MSFSFLWRIAVLLAVFMSVPCGSTLAADNKEQKISISTHLNELFKKGDYNAYVNSLRHLHPDDIRGNLKQADIVEALCAVKRSGVSKNEKNSIVAQISAALPYASFVWQCLSLNTGVLYKAQSYGGLSFHDTLFIENKLRKMGEHKAAQFLSVSSMPLAHKIDIFDFDLSDADALLSLPSSEVSNFLKKAKTSGGSSAMGSISTALIEAAYPLSQPKQDAKRKSKFLSILSSFSPKQIWNDIDRVESLFALNQKSLALELASIIAKNHSADISVRRAYANLIKEYMGPEASKKFVDKFN